MRAEDVKPGMWVQRESPFTEDAIVFQFGNQADNRRAWQAIYRDGSVGWCSHDTLHECEPWVPRVGEWVRLVRTDGVEEMRGPVVSFSTGHLVTFKPPDRACQFWGAAHGHHGGGWYVEPCAPPEAKPETRPADAYLDMLTAETRKACERIGPHLAAVLSEAAEESRQAPKPRDHNATCSRCGGRAYQGSVWRSASSRSATTPRRGSLTAWCAWSTRGVGGASTRTATKTTGATSSAFTRPPAVTSPCGTPPAKARSRHGVRRCASEPNQVEIGPGSACGGGVASAVRRGDRWPAQPPIRREARGRVRCALALGPTPEPDDVDRIIGNKSWTDNRCDECQTQADTVQVGQRPDYESRTADLCESCVRRALAEFEAVRHLLL